MKTKRLVSFTAQKMNLPLRASSENVTKSAKKKKTADLVISTGENTSLQTHHVNSTLKRRGNGRFHVVSTWNSRGVFVGLRIH